MKIQVPLQFQNNSTAIKYPGDRAKWSNAQVSFVNNTIVGDYIGNLYLQDGITKAFDWANFVKVDDYGRIIATNKYLNRFTLDEKAVIELSSIDEPSATTELRLVQAKIRQVLKMLDRETEIPLDNADFQAATIDACEILRTAGMISDAQEKFNYLVYTPLTFDDLPDRLKVYYQN